MGDNSEQSKKEYSAAESKGTDEPKNLVDGEVTRVNKESRFSWNAGSVFWGLLLVAVGTLLLLGNLGWLDVNWAEVWRLWPLLVIAGGFSVLASTHWLWKLLSVLFVLAAIGAVILIGTGRYEAGVGVMQKHESSIRVDQDASSGVVEIKAGASEMNIRSSDSVQLVETILESDSLELNEESIRDGATQRVKLSGDGAHIWWLGPTKNSWDVTLTERLPIDLIVDAGASSINADLSNVRLTLLKLNAGASSTDIKLGDKTDELKVEIDSGASSATIRVPRNSGVSVRFEGGLSSKDFADLKEVSEGYYRSDEYEAASKKIDMIIDAGLASFKLERY